MNTRSSICNAGSRKSSGESDGESYLIEERLQKLLTHTGKQDDPKNIFYTIQEVPRLRRSVMARAVQNVFSSTPMPTNKKVDFHDDSLNISPINSIAEEVDSKDKKSEDDEKSKELSIEFKQPVPRMSIITVSDSEDEELEQNEPKLEGNKIRHAEVVNCTNECDKTKENARNKENLLNNSSNNGMKTRSTSTNAISKAKDLNITKSKHITSLGSGDINKNLSGCKSPKSSKTKADAQITSEQESIKSNVDNNKTTVNVLSVRILRSQNCTFMKDKDTDVAHPNVSKRNKNLKKNKTQNEENDLSRKNTSESLRRVNKSRNEAAVEKIISPAKNFIDEKNESSVSKNSDQTSVAQIISSKDIVKDKEVLKISEVGLQMSPRKLSFTSKDSSDNSVTEKDKKSSAPNEVPVVILSKIPLARSRSKSKEKNGDSKFKNFVPSKTNSSETKDCTEHVKIVTESEHLRKSPPKRPPRKKRIQNETKTSNVPKMALKDPVSADFAEVSLKRNHVDKSVDSLKINVMQNEKSVEKKRDNQIISNEENKLIETGTSPITIFNKNVDKHIKDKEVTKCNSFIDFDRDMCPTVNESKAEKLDALVLKIKMINKEVQTSAKSVTKNRTKHTKKQALTFDGNSTNKSSSTDCSTIIRNFEKERNALFESLEHNDLSIDFSSSDDDPFEDTLCVDEENRPWRLDDSCQIFPRRSSCNLNFLRSAREIEWEKESEKLNQSNNVLDNREPLSIPLSKSRVQDNTKKNKVQVYSRTTLHNNSKISQITRLEPPQCDKVETSVTKNHISNKELPKIAEQKTRSKSSHVETQIDARSPNVTEKTFTDCNGENNRVINTTGTTDKKTNSQTKNGHHLVEDHDEEILAVPLDNTNPYPTSTIKKTNKKHNEEHRVLRSTNKTVKSNTSKRVLRNYMKTFDGPLEDVQQADDVLAVPLETSIPHLNCRDSNSVRVTDENEENNDFEIRNHIEKSHSGSAKKQSHNVEPNCMRASDIVTNVDCGGDDEVHLKDISPQVQNTSLNMSHPANLKSVGVAEITRNSNVCNQMSSPTPINENRHSPDKPPPPKKAVKVSKPKRKKVISENDEGVSSTTTDPEDMPGVRRSRRERKVLQRHFEGKVAIYNEREYFYFNGLSKTTDTVNNSIKPKNKKDSVRNKKGEESGAKKGKRGKKGPPADDVQEPQVSSQKRRKKQSASRNSLGNDQAGDNINSNNIETNVNIAEVYSHSVSQNVIPTKKSKATDTGQNSQENNNTSIRTNHNRTQNLMNSESPVRISNADLNHMETDNNVNVYGTSNDIEENLNHEDFVRPGNLPQGSNRTADKDSGRSTMLRSTFEESSVRISKPLTGRITKSHKKKNDICTKISKVLSRSINTSKEQGILNGGETNTMSSPVAVNITQDAASRRSSIIQLKPSNGEYINLMSGVNLISMRYVHVVPKFKLVKDNLLVTEGLRNFKDEGTMGYLKLLPAGRKPLHIARKFALFYFVMEGEGFLQVHNKTSNISKYSTFLIPVGVEYSIVNTSTEEELFLGFVKVPKDS